MAIRICLPSRSLFDAVHQFHMENVGEFLYPRSVEQFRRLTEEFSILVALDDQAIVGICYVTEDESANRWEFGGVTVLPSQRGSGIASALGTLAIANTFLQHGVAVRALIAHVHVDNPDPRRLLQEHLGFLPTNKVECMEAHEAPSNMRRDATGKVCGDVFAFGRSFLNTFANHIESGRLAKVAVHAELQFMQEAAANAAELRKLASSA